MPTFNRKAKWVRRLMGKGVNRDIRPELVEDGVAADGVNIRPSSITGNDGGIEAIMGERLIYGTTTPAPNSYTLIGSASASGYLVEFWASDLFNSGTGANPPIIRVDGVIVASSPLIPYTYNRPLQVAVVEKPGSGVIYPADHQSPPLQWDIAAMLTALADGEQTYFSGYTTDVNQVVLSAYPEFPKHIANIDAGTGSGLPAGQYSYLLRYESISGDKTNLGPESPLISVALVHDFTWNNTSIPGSRTTGGRPDITTPTRYGIQVEFNIDNTLGFTHVEICRRRFNDGQGQGGPGILEVVGRFQMNAGEFRNFVFTDPADSNILELIPADEEEQRQFDIIAPKAVEYADNRLSYANFQTAPLTPEFVFREVDGAAFVPITGKVTTTQGGVERNSGYTDPVNNTYKKSYTRGEIYGLAIQGWDAKLAKPFAVPLPGGEDYQFPNRRDPKTGDSGVFSDSPVYAATSDCQSASPVGPTYDAFTQGTYAKTDAGTQVNVIAPPFVTGAFTTYTPWSPIGPDDPSIVGYNIKPTYARVLSGSTTVVDNGAVWNPQYNALGYAMYGVDVPSNIKAFTMVRTAPAGRVICQGLATYTVYNTFVSPFEIFAGKRTNRIDFFSRDLQNGYVPQNILEDIQNNPTSYDIQFVCPLGFYTEYYGYNSADVGGEVIGIGTDQLSYAGIQHDEGQVNAGEPGAGGMAYNPTGGQAPPGNYVGMSAWRQVRPPTGQGAPVSGSTNYSYWNQTGNDGNTPMVIQGFTPARDGRSEFYRIDTDDFIYSPGTFDTGGATGFNDAAVRNFAQPWYVVNIIKRGAEVPDGTGQYVNTGATVKMEGCIGASNGSAIQSYRLVNERWEDVLGYLTTDTRYVWVSEVGVPTRAWLCITNNSTINPSLILSTIASNGFYTMPDGTDVYGLYTVSQDDSNYFVNFGLWDATPIPVPSSAARILVRYNKLAPVRVFGGESTIAPSVHAVFDRRYLANEAAYPDPPINIGGLPLPYTGFVKAANYLLPFTSQSLQDTSLIESVDSIRQWCVMYDAESRTQSIMDDFGGAYSQGMPRGHYIIRPYNYANGTTGFFPQYDIDYAGWGPWYNMGGIRFLNDQQQYNQDYWKQPNVQFLGVPPAGGADLLRTNYWNGIIASLEADPELENGPGLRTFLPSNLKLISEENGEIKVIASALGPNGQNMYAWTQDGVCRVLTNKNILTGADGAEVATQSISNYWGTELWLSRTIGCPDQMWRLWAKGTAPVGDSRKADSFFWPDRDSFYRLTGDSITDIARHKYLSVLTPTIENFPTDYTPQTSAFYDMEHDEVWFSIKPQVIPASPPLRPSAVTLPQRLFVYSAQTGEWVGQYTYDFDGYRMNGSRAFGFRNLQSYMLGEGFFISSQIRESSVTVPLVGDVGILKEFTRWAVTGTRPDQIEILDKNYNIICRQNEAIAALSNPTEAQYWTLRYSKGWEQWAAAINVVDGVFQPTDDRPQDEFFYIRMSWFSEGSKQSVLLAASFQNIL